MNANSAVPKWPTFDCTSENSPANRLYVTELPENARPGIPSKGQKKQDCILKFDWYFSTNEGELFSKQFSVPKSGKLFSFKARSSPWMNAGKQVEVFLVNVDDCPQTVSVEYNAELRNPDWTKVKELRGCQEFNYVFKCLDLFRIKGESVEVWPPAEMGSDVGLIPRVYGIKGTLKVIKERVQDWKFVSGHLKELECLQLELNEE
ncbi:hypothetical protein JTE90_002122 [Oedothorax gibbosus]|uniref:Uncharacterized protein n=1 Tax=Oedothorax gibbosus TaxID=931172 RepID=A0AAV6V6E1_9ARAC|nr:hypothetical protein JTE90_002122 [Oedothorax gibbosus]